MNGWRLHRAVKTRAGMVSYGISGSGPDLVLAHGWPWSSFSWHRIIPELARTYRVHWYDMPGYGKSEKSAEYRTPLDVQGEVFAEMLGHWALLSPVVVAHDFGGAVSLRAHLLHRCAYDRLVLTNIVAVRPWGSAFFDHVRKHVEAFQGLPPHIHKAVVEAYVRGALVNELDDKDFERLVEPWISEEGAQSFYRQFALADESYTQEIELSLADVRCPVRIIWGERDPWIPLERGLQLHGLMPEASFDTIPNAGHMPQLETPAAFLEKLRNVLTD